MGDPPHAISRLLKGTLGRLGCEPNDLCTGNWKGNGIRDERFNGFEVRGSETAQQIKQICFMTNRMQERIGKGKST